jgi:hypothetical protein
VKNVFNPEKKDEIMKLQRVANNAFWDLFWGFLHPGTMDRFMDWFKALWIYHKRLKEYTRAL